MEKLHVSAYSGHLQVLTILFLKMRWAEHVARIGEKRGRMGSW